jgi:hypothetical protein
MKAYEVVEVQLHPPLTPELDEGEGLAQAPTISPPEKDLTGPTE